MGIIEAKITYVKLATAYFWAKTTDTKRTPTKNQKQQQRQKGNMIVKVIIDNKNFYIIWNIVQTVKIWDWYWELSLHDLDEWCLNHVIEDLKYILQYY